MALLVLLPGCGGDADMAPVTGMVTLDGEPVPNAVVTFMPSKGGLPSTGQTDPDGGFRLKMPKGDDGAPIGRHLVSVIARQTQDAPTPQGGNEEMASLQGYGPRYRKPKSRSLVPTRYSKFETSGLEFEVKAGAENKAELALTSGR